MVIVSSGAGRLQVMHFVQRQNDTIITEERAGYNKAS